MRSKIPVLCFLILAIGIADVSSLAKPALIEEKKPRGVFPGQNQLMLMWTNQSAEQIDREIKGKVFQKSSKLAMPLPIELRTRLQLLPNQAALTQVSIDVPDLREKVSLLIQWHDGSRVIGKSELAVHSRGILHELETIAGAKGIGIASSDETIKTAFNSAKVNFVEVDKDQAPSFNGRILIVTGFSRKDLGSSARRGAVVICIGKDEVEADDALRPNFFAIPYGRGVVVFVQKDFLEDFDTNPESQLRLVQICRLATKPGRPELPIISPKDSNEN